jgi:hypothetical protein
LSWRRQIGGGKTLKTEEGRKIKRRKCVKYTSERPLCHDSSTSANDVGAAEVYSVKSDKIVMTRRSRDGYIIFIFKL